MLSDRHTLDLVFLNVIISTHWHGNRSTDVVSSETSKIPLNKITKSTSQSQSQKLIKVYS